MPEKKEPTSNSVSPGHKDDDAEPQGGEEDRSIEDVSARPPVVQGEPADRREEVAVTTASASSQVKEPDSDEEPHRPAAALESDARSAVTGDNRDEELQQLKQRIQEQDRRWEQ